MLAHAKKHKPEVLTKTSLMLGLGETEDEIIEAMDDLRAHNVDILTLGQYLQPTKNHLPIDRYVTPEELKRTVSGDWIVALSKWFPVLWYVPVIAQNRFFKRTMLV